MKNITINEEKLRDLYLRNLALGKIKPKPHLKSIQKFERKIKNLQKEVGVFL